MQQKGVEADRLENFEESAVATGSGQTATDRSIIVPTYRFRGIISDQQRTLEVMRLLEFAAAGWITSTGDKLRMVQAEDAPDRGQLGVDDILPGATFNPLGRNLRANTARMVLQSVDQLHPLALPQPMPDAVNTDLKTRDGEQEILDDLGTAEYLTDYYQGQWRLRLYAQQLAYRGRLNLSCEDTADRRLWQQGDKLGANTPDWGELSGYIETIEPRFDGTLAIQLAIGPDLNFAVGALSDLVALGQDVSDDIETDNIPPSVPTGFAVQRTQGGLIFRFTLPPESDYSHTIIRLTKADPKAEDVAREDIVTQSPYNMLGIEEAGFYRVDAAHVDRSGNQSAWTDPPLDVTVGFPSPRPPNNLVVETVES